MTCNAEWRACIAGPSELTNAHVLLLPEETDDRGFAMTSSFTGMVSGGRAGFRCCCLRTTVVQMRFRRWGAGRPRGYASAVHRPAWRGAGFERVVYLGGQEFKGLAREAALKMLELSGGKVVALGGNPVGVFRHGPRPF